MFFYSLKFQVSDCFFVLSRFSGKVRGLKNGFYGCIMLAEERIMAKNLKRSMPRRVDEQVRMMVIGSMPGEESLARQQYYAHPRNNFWTYMAMIFPDIPAGADYELRVSRLLGHRIGLWDVMRSCYRKGSLDSDIQKVTVNDFSVLDRETPCLEKFLFNGAKAYDTFMKSPNRQWAERRGIVCVRMPSTSPADASQKGEDKFRLWKAETVLSSD